MLQMRLTLKDIDYEAVVKMAYPTLLGKISESPSRNLLVHLIRELGEDGGKVLVALMAKLPQDAKNQMVCHCLSSFGTTLAAKLNEYLREDTWGRAFELDGFTAELDNGSLALTARNVQADFKALLKEASALKNLEKIASRVIENSSLRSFTAKAAAKVAEKVVHATEPMTQEELEAAGIALLNNDAVHKKLMDVITKALTKKNVPLTIEEISVENFDLAVLPDENPQSLLNLPEELEDALIKALADFLREME